MKSYQLALAFTSLITSASSIQSYRTHSSIDPTSLRENLLFSAAYSPSPEADKAFQTAFKIIFQDEKQKNHYTDSRRAHEFVAAFLSHQEIVPTLSKNAVSDLSESQRLQHKKLLGHTCTKQASIIDLPNEQIDLARALLLIQNSDDISKVLAEESSLDLLAYEIISRAGLDPTPEKLISICNRLLFYDLGFRFPPKRSSETDIDQFSLLSSVLAQRRGVCLGVSTLYLCIAQRIGLTLQIYTPPGHIFLAYKNSYGEETAIETTCRGVAIPLKEYLGVHLKALRPRSTKEVIGMSYYNLASKALQEKKWNVAEDYYNESIKYCPSERESHTLLASCQLIQNKRREFEKTRVTLKSFKTDDLVAIEPLYFDLIHSNLSQESLEAILSPVADDYISITKHIEILEKLIKKEPHTASLYHQLSSLQMQLGRHKSSLDTLNKLLNLHKDHIPSLYYLTLLQLMRGSLDKAKKNGDNLWNLCKQINFTPEPALFLFRALDEKCGTRYSADYVLGKES